MTEETVPALVDVLKLCKGRTYVNIDLKGASIFDCAAVIKETGTEKMINYLEFSAKFVTHSFKRQIATIPEKTCSIMPIQNVRKET